MNRCATNLLWIGCCIALATGSALAEGGSIDGHWKWNRAQSTTPPDETRPDGVTLEISRADANHLRWSLSVLGSQGPESVEDFSVVADGEFHPVGRDTIGSFRLGEAALQATFKGPNDETDTRTCTVAVNTMTCKGVMVDGAGAITNYVDVYDRM
jgi:hypothetical protein